MNPIYLLDTNIVVALFNKDPSVLNRLARTDGICTSSIVIGELYFGAEKSGRVQKNIERVEDFAANNTVLNCDASTAREYGLTKEQLRAKGRPIPDNDIWIAATCKQHNLILVTRDAHFSQVNGLKQESW